MSLLDFLAGAVTMGFFVCALFFCRFWLRTRDPLFAAFAIAFLLLSLGVALPTLRDVPLEERSGYYLFRLAAFLLIILAIWRKNARHKRQR